MESCARAILSFPKTYHGASSGLRFESHWGASEGPEDRAVPCTLWSALPLAVATLAVLVASFEWPHSYSSRHRPFGPKTRQTCRPRGLRGRGHPCRRTPTSLHNANSVVPVMTSTSGTGCWAAGRCASISPHSRRLCPTRAAHIARSSTVCSKAALSSLSTIQAPAGSCRCEYRSVRRRENEYGTEERRKDGSWIRPKIYRLSETPSPRRHVPR